MFCSKRFHFYAKYTFVFPRSIELYYLPKHVIIFTFRVQRSRYSYLVLYPLDEWHNRHVHRGLRVVIGIFGSITAFVSHVYLVENESFLYFTILTISFLSVIWLNGKQIKAREIRSGKV